MLPRGVTALRQLEDGTCGRRSGPGREGKKTGEDAQCYIYSSGQPASQPHLGGRVSLDFRG